MSIKHVAVCDECGMEVPAGPDRHGGDKHSYYHPTEWLSLTERQTGVHVGASQALSYFCSYACLSKYAGRRGP